MVRKHTGAPLFETGRSGNPRGRPKGARNRLGESFLAALCEDFQQHGPAVIEAVRRKRPEAYLKLVASVLPRELNLSPNLIAGLSDEELAAAIDALKAAVAAGAPEGGRKLDR